MNGHDTTLKRKWVDAHGPIIILVEPQMAENIGTVARAMANFGLTELRMVAPRDGWPNRKAYPPASGANAVLDNAKIFESVEAAVADITLLYAATARIHDQVKTVVGPVEAVAQMQPAIASGEKAAILFGRERNGLESAEVGLANAILTYPVNPGFASLNLAQAVLLIAFEWYKTRIGSSMPLPERKSSPPVNRAQLLAFFSMFEHELDRVEFFRPPEKRESMVLNLRNIIMKMAPSSADIASLHGAISAIAEGAKGPARGGTLDEKGSSLLRDLLAQQAGEGVASPTKGLAKLARRNPTEAERALWQALQQHKVLGLKAYKRAVPIGPHLADFVSFSEKTIVLLVNAATKLQQSEKAQWLKARDYKVVMLDEAEVLANPTLTLERIMAQG